LRAALDLVGKVSDGPSYRVRVAEIVLVIDGQNVSNPWPDLTSVQEVTRRVASCIEAPRVVAQTYRVRATSNYLVVNWNAVRTVQVLER
jgi:hypothetical protein